jgi:hypothetical protein
MGQAALHAPQPVQRQMSSQASNSSACSASSRRIMRRGPDLRSAPLGQAAVHWPH